MTKRNYDENLNWYGWTTPFSGYGIVSLEYMVALDRLTNGKVSVGWQRRVPDNSSEWRTLSPEQQNLIHYKQFEKARLGIIKTTPELFHNNISDVKIGYTMVENSRVGKSWIDKCMAMDALFVPSKYLVDVFKESGFTKPICTVKQGINSDLFKYVDRKKNVNKNKKSFIFATAGWLDERKNWQEMVTAFTSEFDNNEPVELWLKNSNDTFGYEQPADERVKFIDELLSLEGMQVFYKNIDCFLFCSRAEGAGMPGREAMATGLPVILTNWSGMADVCNSEYNYPMNPVAIDLPDTRNQPDQPGFQARIDIKELMYWMRYIYEHQDEAYEKGKLASAWMHKEYNWGVCANEMLDLLEKEFGYH